MAGAIRLPHSKMAAMAKPVGGQMGVALGLIEASRSPRSASAKYATQQGLALRRQDRVVDARCLLGLLGALVLLPSCRLAPNRSCIDCPRESDQVKRARRLSASLPMPTKEEATSEVANLTLAVLLVIMLNDQ